MNLTLKVAAFVSSVGGVAGGGFLLKNHFSSSKEKKFTILDLISRSKTKVLVRKDGGWSKLWEKYKKDNENRGEGKDSWKLVEWKGSRTPTSIPKSYKERCTSLSNEKVEGWRLKGRVIPSI